MKRFYKLFVVLIVSLNASSQQANFPDSNYNMLDSVLIKTRDGGSIFALIVRKKGNVKPLPVVLFFTTYYLGPADANLPKRSADRDYVGIIAYSRGVRTDMKNFSPFEHDASDVYDVIEWTTRQPWSNGKVGMYGGSYTGFVQWAATKKLHPALKTIAPLVAVMPGFDFPMENNIPLSSIVGWTNDIYKYPRLRQELYLRWYELGLSYKSLDSLSGHPNTLFQKWMKRPDYDDYWKSFIPTPGEYAKINIPILVTTGYYDGTQISAMQYVKQYLKYNKNPQLHVVIGPYDHVGAQRIPSPILMGYIIDSIANVDMRELALQWLDHILKDDKKPDILKDRINYQVMGSNEWKHASSLEKMNNDTLTLYLSDVKDGPFYTLAEKKPPSINYLNQSVDFSDRSANSQHNYYTSTIINDSLNSSNGTVFITPIFRKPFSINGSFTGNLEAMINKYDMDVSITLYEQESNDKYFYLTRFLGRASYAKDPAKRQLLTPGKNESIPFNNTRIVSKRVGEGSRLVIIVNVNKHPFEVINYGTGKNVNDETIQDAKQPLQIRWYNNSYIKIPVWN